GTSNLFGPALGRMAKNLAAGGVDPAAVDMVILTHLHPDHAAGLLTTDKKIAFPNATVHVSEAEYAFWPSPAISPKAPDDFKPLPDIAGNSIKPYADAGKVERFKDRTEFAPGIVASAAPGHTRGHTMIRLSSGSSELLLWGDIVHNAALQFPEPDRAISFDTDQAMAIATRKRVFDMTVTDKLLIAGSHLPFPGLGHVAKASTGYAYVPLEWGADLGARPLGGAPRGGQTPPPSPPHLFYRAKWALHGSRRSVAPRRNRASICWGGTFAPPSSHHVITAMKAPTT